MTHAEGFLWMLAIVGIDGVILAVIFWADRKINW